MRVFYFITKSENGGAQTMLSELCRGHIESGDTVALMSHGGGWLEMKCKELGVTFYDNQYLTNTLNPFRVLKAMREYRNAMHDFKPDVISCHSSVAGFIGRIGAWNKYPVVFTARGWGFTNGVPLWRKIIAIIAEKFSSHFCKKIICVSDFDRNLAIKYHIASPSKLVTVHNGVNVGGKQWTDRNDGRVVIVFNGRLAVPKRQDKLVRAFAKLPVELQAKAEMMCIGGGPFEKPLRELAKQLGVSNKLTITGEVSREKCIEIMAQSDLFVLISDWEGYPVSIAEGLQVGLPVIANNVGGVAEMVNETVGALLPTRGYESLFQEKLTWFITHDAERKQKGADAFKQGNAYTQKEMKEKIMSIYHEIMTK